MGGFDFCFLGDLLVLAGSLFGGGEWCNNAMKF